MALDLKTLPDINFADSDTSRVLSSCLAVAERLLGRTLYPGDPMRLCVTVLAYMFSQQRAVLDYTGKQTLLRYAHGAALDHLGAIVGAQRLGRQPSLTTLEFTLAATLAYDAVIPVGTRGTADGAVNFATDAQAVIPAGGLTATVNAISDVAGPDGNGLAPGQINKLVDPLPFPVSVSNISISNGGSGVEDDEHLRERIQLAPESFSTAGPELAYKFWAMSAHPDIIDVSVLGPEDGLEPGHVDLRVLMEGGAAPSPEILALVLEAVTGERRRPLTDYVTAAAPETSVFDLEVEWWILQDNAALLTSVEAGVNAAVAGWLDWQVAMIGRDINVSELNRRMVNAGAKRVNIISPVFTHLDKKTMASFNGNKTVTYKGAEGA